MKLRRGVLGLRRVTDVDANRYALGGIQVVRQDNGSVRTEATTGHSMVVAWFEPDDTDDEFQDVIVPANLCERIASLGNTPTANKKRIVASQSVQLDSDARRVSVTVEDDRDSACFSVPSLEGRFPKTATVWPNVEESLSIEIDAHRLMPVLAAIAELVTDENEDNRARVTLTLGKDSPILLVTAAANECHVAGILYCLKSDSKASMQFDPKAMYGKEAPPVKPVAPEPE